MICPSCGREIPDDVDICPYCTANVKSRIKIVKFYILAVILIIVGASYATLAYTSSEVPVVKICDLGIGDNYKFVHVRGEVADYPHVYESEYGVSELRITISDGTDELTIKIYRDLIGKMVEENKVPGIGDVVDAQGIFTYTTQKSLTINEAKNFRILSRGSFREMKVNEIASGNPWKFREGDRVWITGNITGVREYSFGYIARIDDSIDVVIPRSYSSLKIVDFRDMGSGVVKIYGVLKFYRSKEPTSSYQEVNLSAIMQNPEKYNGTNVNIRWAEVVEKNESGSTIKIDVNGTTIQVYVGYGVDYYDIGDHVEVAGKFINYYGTWEIKVTRKTDFVSEPKWELVMHPSYALISEKNYEHGNLKLFELRNITGIVADYRKTGNGISITLWNTNGTYNIYVENIDSVNGKIDYGSKIVVKGMVTMYRGSYEIKVRAFTSDIVEVIS